MVLAEKCLVTRVLFQCVPGLGKKVIRVQYATSKPFFPSFLGNFGERRTTHSLEGPVEIEPLVHRISGPHL